MAAGAQLWGGRGRKLKKSALILEKKCLHCVQPLVKFAIQNVVLRVSKRKIPKFFLRDLFSCLDLTFFLPCPEQFLAAHLWPLYQHLIHTSLTLLSKLQISKKDAFSTHLYLLTFPTLCPPPFWQAEFIILKIPQKPKYPTQQPMTPTHYRLANLSHLINPIPSGKKKIKLTNMVA